MSTQLVPYSFNSAVLPALPTPVQTLAPGMVQGVHFTVPVEAREGILAKVERWFADRDDVIFVDSGISNKQQFGYIVLEWDGYEIDPLFLAILREEDLVDDFTVYNRSEEV
jgi:hypothetical protein